MSSKLQKLILEKKELVQELFLLGLVKILGFILKKFLEPSSFSVLKENKKKSLSTVLVSILKMTL